MSDDKHPKHSLITWAQEDEDIDDATVQLSLKDVFRISREDLEKGATP